MFGTYLMFLVFVASFECDYLFSEVDTRVNGEEKPKIQDKRRPEVPSANPRGFNNRVYIKCSEEVDEESATDLSNYEIDGTPFPSGSSAILSESKKEVFIQGPFQHQLGDRKEIKISGILDKAIQPNQIIPTTKIFAFIPNEGFPFAFDGHQSEEFSLFGNAKLQNSGGISNSGFLSLTDGVANQSGALLFNDKININQAVIKFDARIGNTSEKPGDGFSLNIAQNILEGVYPKPDEGYSGNEFNIPEGLIVSFDNWVSSEGDKGFGIEVKYKGESKAHVSTPSVSSGGEPTEDENGIPSIHRGNRWFTVSIDLRSDGTITLDYDNVRIMDALDIGWEGITNA